jgi:hypothetical protein
MTSKPARLTLRKETLHSLSITAGRLALRITPLTLVAALAGCDISFFCNNSPASFSSSG